LLARFRHPNVVTVYGVDHHNGRQGVWMEYIRGCTLAAFLQQHGPLAAREATLIGLDVCSAVAATHALGLLHRDIKAKNVMREEGGRIVLLDFGLSQDLRAAGLSDPSRRVRGTPLYMAPELLRGGEASAQSDIFGIGVLLYHLVSGSYPAGGRNLPDVRGVYERGEAKLLRDRRADLPESFLRTIDRSLSPDPDGRFATAGQMAQMLSTSLLAEISHVSRAAS
jgi:eukaryotic-like serine/threonine-protein kinase